MRRTSATVRRGSSRPAAASALRGITRTRRSPRPYWRVIADPDADSAESMDIDDTDNTLDGTHSRRSSARVAARSLAAAGARAP